MGSDESARRAKRTRRPGHPGRPPERTETPAIGVLDEAERMQVEIRFGVDSDQVIRDHVISHALAAIASLGTDAVVFFGGTALARTHLTDVRLSEDIDSDAPPARLRVLTPAAFVSSKLSSWNDREAPRDLYDLIAVNPTEAALVVRETLATL